MIPSGYPYNAIIFGTARCERVYGVKASLDRHGVIACGALFCRPQFTDTVCETRYLHSLSCTIAALYDRKGGLRNMIGDDMVQLKNSVGNDVNGCIPVVSKKKK